MSDLHRTFSHTMRSLDSDSASPTVLAIVLIAALAGVWTGWLIAARVPVYELSAAARLEVERVHPVAAPVAGRVVTTALALGREVKAGDVLVEIEAARERIETDRERARASSIQSELEQLDRAIRAEQEGLEAANRASRAAALEASQRVLAVQAGARQAAEKLERLKQLAAEGLVSVAEASAAQSELTAKQAELAAAQTGLQRLTAEHAVDERARRGRVASLVRERVALEGQHAATVSSVAASVRSGEPPHPGAGEWPARGSESDPGRGSD